MVAVAVVVVVVAAVAMQLPVLLMLPMLLQLLHKEQFVEHATGCQQSARGRSRSATIRIVYGAHFALANNVSATARKHLHPPPMRAHLCGYL